MPMTSSNSGQDYRIFVSHHSKDQAIARALGDLLVDAFAGHVEPFISSAIPVGNNWLHDVKDALATSAELLTIFTHRSMHRAWVNIETGHAVMQGLPVTPLLFDNLRTEDLPVVFQVREAVIEPDDDAITSLFDSILQRLVRHRPRAQAKFGRNEFLARWRASVSSAERQSPRLAGGPVTEPMLWIIGSHDTQSPARERTECLAVAKTIARLACTHRFRLVLGASRLLDYLADTHEAIVEDEARLLSAPGEPLRKTLGAAHAEARPPAHHPVVLLGSLRTPDIRRRFDDALGRVPHMAVVIGGRSRNLGGRTHEECEAALGAGIPLLPISFTGGAAAEIAPSLNAAAMHLLAPLQMTSGRLDRFEESFMRILEAELGLSVS